MQYVLISLYSPLHLYWISVRGMFIYNPHIKSKSHNLAHNPLFPLYIFRRTKVIESIVTVVYKQGHLVLGFQHTWVEFIRSWIFCWDPYCSKLWCYDGQLASAGQSSCDQSSGDWFQKVWYGAPERLASDSSWQYVITCLEPLLNCWCYFKFSGCTVTLERYS